MRSQPLGLSEGNLFILTKELFKEDDHDHNVKEVDLVRHDAQRQ